MTNIKYGHVYNTEEAPDVLFVPIYPIDEGRDAVIIINLYRDEYFARDWDNMTMGHWMEVDSVSRLSERKMIFVIFSLNRAI